MNTPSYHLGDHHIVIRQDYDLVRILCAQQKQLIDHLDDQSSCAYRVK